MKKTYRYNRSYLRGGILMSVVIFAILITSVTVALLNPDGSFKRPVLGAVIFGCFWGGVLTAALWMIVRYLRGSVSVDSEGIRMVGAFREKTIQFSEVEHARWIVQPWIGLKIRAVTGTVKLSFDDFPEAEAKQLARCLRERLNPEIDADCIERFDEWIDAPVEMMQFREGVQWLRQYVLTGKVLLAGPVAGFVCGCLLHWFGVQQVIWTNWPVFDAIVVGVLVTGGVVLAACLVGGLGYWIMAPEDELPHKANPCQEP